MTTSTRQHGTADSPRGWVFQTNLRTAAGRLARRPVTAKSHQFGLFWRVFAVNGVILLIAFALLVLTPITVSSPTTTDQLLVLSAGLAVMLVANAALLRFSLTPLRRLADQMGTVDVLDPGERLERSGTAEVATVIEAFNTALDRLEAERRSSTRRVLFAQEAERRRIAQELHDQIGQDLTAVVLELKRVQARVTPEEAETLADAQELARESLEDLRRISHQLRPVALDDLGLSSAIAVAVRRHHAAHGVRHRVRRRRRDAAPDRPRHRAGDLPGRAGVDHQRRAPRRRHPRRRHADGRAGAGSCCASRTTARGFERAAWRAAASAACASGRWRSAAALTVGGAQNGGGAVTLRLPPVDGAAR